MAAFMPDAEFDAMGMHEEFGIFESLLRRQSLTEVLGFAAQRLQSAEVEDSHCPISSAPTVPVPFSPWERGTDSIPISVTTVEEVAA